jgi:ankyrin repeat protein
MASKQVPYSVAKKAQTFFGEAINCCMTGQVDTLRTLIQTFLDQQQDDHNNNNGADGNNNVQLSVSDVVESFQSEGKTLIHVAASSGHPHVLSYLLSCLQTPSTAATTTSNSSINNSKRVSELVNMADSNGFTPLINATISESAESMTLLLDLGANPNAQNKDGATALHFAAGDGSVQRMTLLLEKGADTSIVSKSGSCLHWAAGKGHVEAVRLLLNYQRGEGGGARVDVDQLSPEGLPAVLLAAVAMSEQTVVELVKAGANTGHILTGNLTLLHICAEHGLEQAVRAIVQTETGQKCCYVCTDDGNMPIHLAAMSGDRAIVELMLPYSLDAKRPSSSTTGNMPTQLALTEATSVDAIMEDGKLRTQLWNDKHKQSQEVNSAGSNAGAASASTLSSEQLSAATAAPDAAHPEYAANQERAQGFKEKGNQLFIAKKFDQAADAYTEAIKLQPNNHVLYSNRSACYIAVKDPQSALRDAELCRHLAPDWPKGCYRLALARFELGLYEDAAVAAFEGCKLDENNEELKTLMQKAVKKGREEHQRMLSEQDKSKR